MTENTPHELSAFGKEIHKPFQRKLIGKFPSALSKDITFQALGNYNLEVPKNKNDSDLSLASAHTLPLRKKFTLILTQEMQEEYDRG